MFENPIIGILEKLSTFDEINLEKIEEEIKKHFNIE